MRSAFRSLMWKFIPCAGAAALALAFMPGAAAQCGLPNKAIKPMGWLPLIQRAQPTLLSTAFDDWSQHEPSIVGMWHAVFTAHTQDGEPIPGAGAVIDNSVVQWHGDGTEIMNSARAAQDGNFCLGVWKRTGERTYLLNHIPWMGNVYDPTVPPDAIGKPQGGVQIIEKITLARDGNSYSGSFTLHAYDTSGNVYTWFTGKITAKRITPDTPFSSLL